MSEQGPTINDPKEQLIALLSSDFTSQESLMYAREAENTGNALSSFLATARSPEDVIERLETDECVQLASDSSDSLALAPITDAFKGIIVGYLVKAYAWEKKVDELVSPQNLGLLQGEGIFDPEHAKTIEGETMRRFLIEIINEQVMLADDIEEIETASPIITNPVQYEQYMTLLDEWMLEYIGRYGEDAFVGTEPGYYMIAAKRVHIMSDEDAEESGWSDLIERLNRLREKPESE